MNTTSNLLRIRRVSVATLMLLTLPIAAASVAYASDTILPDGRSATVSVRDLDLSTAEGRTIARGRVYATARTLCARIRESTDLDSSWRFRDCVATASDQAMTQILNPHLAGTSKAPPAAPAAVAASSAGPDQVRRVHVSLTDLDLSTPEGVKAAHARVLAVAHRLCWQVADPSDLSHHSNFLACVDAAMANAELDIQALAVKRSTSPAVVLGAR